jgi:hypothetical protein
MYTERQRLPNIERGAQFFVLLAGRFWVSKGAAS